jgi:hypothetical protein
VMLGHVLALMIPKSVAGGTTAAVAPEGLSGYVAAHAEAYFYGAAQLLGAAAP